MTNENTPQTEGKAAVDLPRLVRRREVRDEVTAWILHTTHPKGHGYSADTAIWVRKTPPSKKLLEKEMGHHPSGSSFWLRRERGTSWAHWTPPNAQRSEPPEKTNQSHENI